MKFSIVAGALAAASLAVPAFAQSAPTLECPAGSELVQIASEEAAAPEGQVIVARQAQYAASLPVSVCVAPKGSPLAASNPTPMIVAGALVATTVVAVAVAGGDDTAASR